MSEERIGVYVCHCGSNIAGVVDVAEVARWAGEKLKHRGVVIARDYKFMCSSLGQELIINDVKEHNLTLSLLQLVPLTCMKLLFVTLPKGLALILIYVKWFLFASKFLGFIQTKKLQPKRQNLSFPAE
jgi:hypothetical protein